MDAKTTRKRPSKSAEGFSDGEKAAMKARAREAKKGNGDGEADVLAALREMTPSDRAVGERIHALVKANAPSLAPKTWYGMPAYANAEGQAVCFFQSAAKFKARYSTFGFSDKAKLDDGDLWPTSFALKELTPAAEKKIVALVKKAVGG